MILNNIDNLYVGSTNALKVYLGSLLIWSLSNDDYDIISTDITSYTGNKSRVYVVDVAKWYMRTIGGNYTEYGIYASSKSADPYVGELAIDNGHEWEYTSNGWVDLGAYRLPSGYTELTYVGVRTINSQSPSITLNYYPQEATVIDAKFRPLGEKVVGQLYRAVPNTNTTSFNFIISNGATSQTTYWRFYPTNVKQAVSNIIQPNNDYVFKSESSGCWLNNKKIWSRTGTYPSQNTSKLVITNNQGDAYYNLYYFNISENNTALYTLVPSLRNIDGKIGLYDITNNIFYLSDYESTNPYSAGDVIPYPKEYAVIPSPVDVIPTDITSYTGNADRVYVVDVEKWYMRTVGGNYKEYGVYASSKSSDPYIGELAIDNYHEWEYTETGWVDLGALTTHTEYEYVQGNGTSYIITDYVPQPNASVEVDCDGYVQSCVFGSREDKNTWEQTRYGYFGIEYINTFLVFLYGSTTYSTRDSVIESRGVVKIDNVGGYVGTRKLVNVSTSIPSDCKGHCGIFCCTETDNITGVETVSSRGIYTKKIYDVKIYENGTLVRHYIPAIKNGAVGFYETENKVLWDSEVSTPFTVGGSSREVLDALIKEYEVLPAPTN